MGQIYGIKHKDKWYIGGSINYKRRWSEHKSYLKRNKHHSIKLQRIYNKYGLSSLEFIVLEDNIKNEELVIKEQYYIDLYDSYYKGLNGRPDAIIENFGDKNGMFGQSPPNKGKPCMNRKSVVSYKILDGSVQCFDYVQQVKSFGFSDGAVVDVCRNKNISCKGYFFFYKELFNLQNLKNKFEAITNKYIKLKGVPRPQEIRNKISLGNKGKPKSESHIQNMRKSLEYKELNKISIIRSDGVIFDSLKSAAINTNVNPSTISHHLAGRRKTVKGFTFVRV